MSNASRQASKKLPEKVYRNVVDLDKVFFTGDPTKLDGLGKVDLPAIASNKTNLNKDFTDAIAKQLKKGVIPENVDVGNMVVLRKSDTKGIEVKSGNGEWKPAFKLVLQPKVADELPTFKQVFSEEIKPEALAAFQASSSKQGLVSRVDNAKTDDFATPVAEDVMGTGGINEGGYGNYVQQRTVLSPKMEAKLSDPDSTLGWWLGARSKNTADTPIDARKPDIIDSGLKRFANTFGRPAAALTGLNLATGFSGENNPEAKGWVRRFGEGTWEAGKTITSNFKEGVLGMPSNETLGKQMEAAKVNAAKVAYSATALRKISPSFTLDKDTLNRSFSRGLEDKTYNPSALSSAMSKHRGKMTDKEFFSIPPDVMMEKLSHRYSDEVALLKSQAAADNKKPNDSDYPDIKAFINEIGEGKKGKERAFTLPSWMYERDTTDDKGQPFKRVGVKATAGGKERNLIPVIVASNTEEERTLQDNERVKAGKPKPIEASKQLKYVFIDQDEKDPTKKFFDASDVELKD